MNTDEVLGWIDPLNEYKLSVPTCQTADFMCWEFDETTSVQLHAPGRGAYKLLTFVGGMLELVVESDDVMYILNKCRDEIAALQYRGVWV